MAHRRIVTVVDCETGGLDKDEHPITQVAMLSFYLDNLSVIEEYSSFIKVYGGLTIDPIVFEKTTVTPQDVANGKEHWKVVEEMIAFFKRNNSQKGKKRGNTVLLGHNIVGFDREFLEYIFLLNGYDIYDYISGTFIDTLPRSEEIWPEEDKHNLTIACSRAGVKLVGAHGAIADVRANYDLFCYMVKTQRKGLNNKSQEDSKVKTEKVANFFKF
jgi:DNA polymerase III epsilon subunit-like protein